MIRFNECNRKVEARPKAGRLILVSTGETFYCFTVFAKLQMPDRAIPAYVRETLALIALEREDEATQRFGTLQRLVEATTDDGLRSAAKVVEAWREAEDKNLEDAVKRLEEAEELARKSNDRLRLATVLVHRALLDPSQEGLTTRGKRRPGRSAPSPGPCSRRCAGVASPRAATTVLARSLSRVSPRVRGSEPV